MSNKNDGKVLSMTIVFEAESLNYGEGIGNVSQLKKLTRYNSKTYPYLSRQSLRYNIANQMNIDNSKLMVTKDVIQYDSKETIETSVEQDLFGYMITDDDVRKRTACVRLSNAIALESYNSDTDFLTNLSFLNRYNSTVENKKAGGNIAQSEIHKSYYVYNLVIDLDMVGIDENTQTFLSQDEKARRINTLLDAVLFLSRDIKGRTESLIPKFVVGGFYSRKNSFFSNTIKCYKNNLMLDTLKSVLNLNDELGKNTKIAMMDGVFSNEAAIKKDMNVITVREMFDYVKDEVEKYYVNKGN